MCHLGKTAIAIMIDSLAEPYFSDKNTPAAHLKAIDSALARHYHPGYVNTRRNCRSRAQHSRHPRKSPFESRRASGDGYSPQSSLSARNQSLQFL
jgi:hypothetical protein